MNTYFQPVISSFEAYQDEFLSNQFQLSVSNLSTGKAESKTHKQRRKKCIILNSS